MKEDCQWNKGKSFSKSVGYAFSGIVCFLKTEANFRTQLLAGILVFVLAWMLKLSLGHLSILVMTVTFVLVMEIVNAAVEKMADVVHPNQHEEVRKLKDMMAGAVMLSCVSAAVVGLLIFVPPIVSLFIN